MKSKIWSFNCIFILMLFFFQLLGILGMYYPINAIERDFNIDVKPSEMIIDEKYEFFDG